MTGRRGSGPLIVVAVLRIDCGQQTRSGHWLRLPTADYQCLRCGHTDSASGDHVPAFVRDVRRTHNTTCTRKESTP